MLSTTLVALAWAHLTLNSAAGVQTQIDYQLDRQQPGPTEFTLNAKPVWINVTRDRAPLTAANHVRVLLTPWSYNESKDGAPPSFYPGTAQALDLAYAGHGRFTVGAKPIYLAGGNESGGLSYTTKVSVDIDNVWQVDTSDGKTDFLADLAGAAEPAPPAPLPDCAAFIEKASATAHEHHIEILHLFVKTHLPAGTEASVVFHGQAKLAGRPADPWYDLPLKAYPGATDYYQLDLPISAHNDIGITVEYVRGELFLQTPGAAALWLKPADGSDFYFDETFFTNLEHAMKWQGVPGATYNPDYGRTIYTSDSPDSALWTRTAFPYLNAHGCQ